MAEEEGNWVVLLHYHHQGGLRPAGYARPVRRAAPGCKKYLPAPQCGTRPLTPVILALPKAAMVTGGLEGHDPPGEVEGGGLDALASVSAHRGAKRQRT